MNRFEQIKASGDLPSPRGVALAVIRLTRDDDVSMSELTQVIKSDPAFVGRLIKAANGTVRLSGRAIVSVPEALVVLGLPAVRTMALGFSLLSSYRKGVCPGFDYVRFWSSSLLMALSMQVIALRVRAIAADEAFSIGLLARIGELALATLYPAGYGRLLLEAQRTPKVKLAELEQQAFAMNHHELGAAMLADWGVPPVFTGAVLYFGQAEESNFDGESRTAILMQSLVLSRAIAEICLAPEIEQAGLMPAVLRLGTRLGLSREDFAAACECIGREWVEWGKLLQLETNDPPSFSELIRQNDEKPLAGTARPDLPGNGTATVPGADGMRVLVADDEAAVRKLLRNVLEEAGHAVLEAETGQQCMELALETQPHMMVIDWSMKGMEGLHLVRALRATRVGRGIYILLVTHGEDDERLIEAFETGVDDFLVKPVKPKIFGARLRAGQRTVRLQQELEHEREELRHFAAELAITNRRLQEAALTDALTGFPNRRYAIDRIGQEWTATTRNRHPMSCMIIDLDGFKQINDTWGHDIGDSVLRQVSAALRTALRGHDVICRTGGDEFLVICPDTALEAALVCGERLRCAVENFVINTGDLQLQLTISVGVATRDGTMEDFDALIKRADQGAYAAKGRGRNRVASVQ